MAPKSLDLSNEYVSEDKDQRIVETPYGRGVVIRTREAKVKDDFSRKSNSMKEIELLDWGSSTPENGTGTSKAFVSKSHMLYSPTDFPSVSPIVGSDVVTKWGRGKVIAIRDDYPRTHVIKLSSWRLAGRSSVFCYVPAKECEVTRPKTPYEMNVFEKIEHANDLKQQATVRFKEKDYDGALELFARSLDAVRYVQHKADSTNEVRADLIVVMITCSNNAALCSSKKEDWERTEKFAANALVLIEALEERGDESKIRRVLNGDGIGDSQLFGTWKVKSLLLTVKAQMERHDASKTVITLKKAIEAVSEYKKEGDIMFKQLSTQEKDIRRLRLEFAKRNKAAKVKEKERARAMFGREGTERENSKQKELSLQDAIPTSKPPLGFIPSDPLHSNALDQSMDSKKTKREIDSIKVDSMEKQSNLNGKPESGINEEDEDEDDGFSQPSFFEEHSEALLILSGIAVVCFFAKVVAKKR